MTEISETDIAIVGMAAHVPGATNPDAFWDNVVAGTDALVDLTESELRKAGVDRATLRDPNYVRRAGVLETVDQFDPAFFGIGERDAAIMDPQHRHLLECAWEALEMAAIDPAEFDGAVGVYAGCGMNTYLLNNLLGDPSVLESMGWFLLRHTSNDKDFLPTFISYKLDLHGPSVSVQTACSTSLVAIHLAAQSLLDFECDMAIAGGSTIEAPHAVGYEYQEGEILSPDGHCRAFDADSAGTVLTSGTGAVVLRRLVDAVEDGDPILAVMKGSAINNDGARKVGYLAPSVEGHADVVREALAVADLSARDITLLEAHGTGTALGDPIEVAALTDAFRDSTDESGYCRLVSSKPNIGHLDTAAGVASVVKVVQALRNKTLPPLANFSAPNPLLDLDGSPFLLSADAVDWEPGRPRRAGVSSLGVGGTNAHAIFEEAPERPASPPSHAEQVLAISGATADAVKANAARLADHLEANPQIELGDVSHTLLTGRRAFAHRRVVVATDTATAVEQLRAPDRRRSSDASTGDAVPSVAFMFPGGGAQYARMAQGLDDRFSTFHDTMSSGIETVADLGGPDLRPMLADEDGTALTAADASLPAVFLTSLALARQWQAWGTDPDLLLGHSLGEYVAAHLAGVMSLEDAVRLVVGRSRLMASVGGADTGMMVVPLAEAELLDRLPDDVSLAVVNAADECVIAGPAASLDALEAAFVADDVQTNRLRLAAAAHSAALDPVLDEFRELAGKVAFSAPQIPYMSNLTGTWITESDAMSADYWTRHLRGTVRFADNLRTAFAEGPTVTIELGPGQALSSYARRQDDAPVLTVASLRHPDDPVDDTAHTLHAFAKPWTVGVDVDLTARAGADRQRIVLPTYAFQHSRYWVEPTQAPAAQVAAKASDDGELVRIDDVDSWFWMPTWAQAPKPAPAAATGSWLVLGEGTETEALAAELVRRGADADVRAELDRELDDVAGVLVVGAAGADTTGVGLASERHVHQALDIVRGLGRSGATAPRFGVVTNGATDAAGLAARPVDAVALGPVLVAPKEYPGLAATLVDVASGEFDVQAVVDDVLGEQPVVAHTADGRVVPDLRSVDVDVDTDHEPLVTPGGTYVVTGGLGDIGFGLCEHLAAEYGIKIAAVASTPVPEGDDLARVLATHGSGHPVARRAARCKRLQEVAKEFALVTADLADRAQVAAAFDQIEAELGRVDGVLHLAGVVHDSLIEMASADDIAAVMQPKAHGAANLLDELERRSDHASAVLMSSTSTVIAAEGQAAYVAANAYLDSLAGDRPGLDIRTMSSGTWAGTGRAADLAVRTRLGLTDGEQIAHPVFTERSERADGSIVLVGRLDEAADWVLDEHRTTTGQAVLPGTAHVSLLIAAARSAGLEQPRLSDVFLASAVVADTPGAQVTLRITAEPEGDGWMLTLESDRGTGNTWFLHSQAAATAGSGPATPAWIAPLDAGAEQVPLLAQQHATLQLGPRWLCGEHAQTDGDRSEADLVAPVLDVEAEAWAAHPALLDVVTALGVTLAEHDPSTLYVPARYDSVTSWRTLPTHVTAHAARRSAIDDDVLAVDLFVATPDGEPLLSIEGLHLHALDATAEFVADDDAAADAPRDGAAFLDLAEELGIRLSDLGDVFQRVAAVPEHRLLVSSVDVEDLRTLAEPEVVADDDSGSADEAAGLEGSLAQLWSELLGVDTVGEDDDFFDLGGHSLIAIRMTTRIQKKFGVRLQMVELLDASTVSTLAAKIREMRPDVDQMFSVSGQAATSGDAPEVIRSATRTLVHLNRDGDGTPFTVIHGAGGNILFLSPLAREMRGDRPLVGMQAWGVDAADTPDPSIEKMAERYVAELVDDQPDGPYLLGGYSGGALIAVEMTHQLRAQGRDVKAIVSIDGTEYRTDYPSNRDARRFLLKNLLRSGPRPAMPYLKSRLLRRLSRWLAPESNMSFGGAAAFEAETEAAGLVNLWDHMVEVHTNYERKKIDIPMAVFKADLVWPYHPVDYHWSRIVTGEIGVFTSPGNHFSMVGPNNIEAFWHKLKPVLDDFDHRF